MDNKRRQNNNNEILQQINSQLVLDENNAEEEEGIVEVTIDNYDYLNDIKQKISNFILDIVSTIKNKEQVNQKQAFLLTYDEIINKIDYYRDREKQKIKNYFKQMPVDERKPEIELKKLRLGVFAIDNQKLTTYGKETGFYENVFNKKDLGEGEGEEEEEYDADEIIYANERDEDDNLDIQQNEDDFEDINDNVFEDMNENDE